MLYEISLILEKNMKLAIKQDPRFKHPFSLKFGVREYTDEEYEIKKKHLLRTFGLFFVTSAISVGISFLNKSK